MTFEFIGSECVRIGACTLRVQVTDTPLSGGTTHLVEATSGPSDKLLQKVSPADLAGVKAESIPKGFQLTIYRPETKVAGLDYLAVENIRYGLQMVIALDYSFSNWARRTTVPNFAEIFRRLIEQELRACRDVRIEKNEYGVSLWISLSLDPSDDCYAKYTEVEDSLGSLYRQALLMGDKKLDEAASAFDTGFRWWLRYVIVPIVSGGTGAALVVWLLSRA